MKKTERVGKLLEEYRKYDIPIKALTHEVAKDWQAYLAGRLRSGNSVGIHLRSLQSIVNDAARSFPELKGHHPFQGIRKKSTPNKPVVLTLEEVQRIRDAGFLAAIELPAVHLFHVEP